MTIPVLLVHGFASSFDMNWRRTGWVDLLGDAGREVLGVDLLGHGDAPRPHQPAAYADLGARVREAVPQGPIDAVGFSLGATVLLRLAAAHPGLIRRLVAGGVGEQSLVERDSESLARIVEKGSAAVSGQSDSDSVSETHELGRAFTQFADAADNDRLALAACLRRPPAEPLRDLLGRIDAEVLVVTGDKDFVGDPQVLASMIPRGTAKKLRGIDHFGTPQAFSFLDAGLAFLEAGRP